MTAKAIGCSFGATRRGQYLSRQAPTALLVRPTVARSRRPALLPPLEFPAVRAAVREVSCVRAAVREVSWPVERDQVSLRRARHSVTEQLRGWGLDRLAGSAELLASELVTNALRYTRGRVRLNLRIRGSRLHCEVEDSSHDSPARREAGADAEGGRGLELLEALTEDWVGAETATGKTVWFELKFSPFDAEVAS
ncbi:ATP-binding protein [Streptomyces sp. NPDC020362]|uniref:ATP-binding protein n=1 Tax=unclassified Streptomyces TaxID=2593676 RepID=UPI0033DE7503